MGAGAGTLTLPSLAAGRRLSRYVLLAIVLHGLLLFGLRLPPSPASAVLPRLELRLAPTAEKTAPVPPDPTPRLRPAPPPTGNGAGRGSASPSRESPAPAPTAAPTAAPAEASRPAGRDLAASAVAFVHDESRRRGGDPMAQPSTLQRGTPSPFERAAARPVAGEQVLREGVVKITLPNGHSYCLQRPPEVANRDGPVPVLSIPMTCPIEF